MAHCSPRAGGVKRCQHAVAGSLHQASAAIRNGALGDPVVAVKQPVSRHLSPAAAAREVESTMSVNRTVASTLSVCFIRHLRR